MTAPPSSFRVVLNRFVFRSMLFSMGLTAVCLYQVDRSLAWKFAKASARNLARMCGVRVLVRGVERLGNPPYVFTPNHTSHFDIAALLGYLPGVNRFAAKKDLFSEPILGLVLKTLGMIPVERDDPSGTIERLRRIDASSSLIIFPEGTRSSDGNLLPFKKGAFVAAIQAGLPVVPVVCKGGTEVMPKGRYLSITPGTVEIVVLEPIITRGMTYEQRDELRDTVRARIAQELGASRVGVAEEPPDMHPA